MEGSSSIFHSSGLQRPVAETGQGKKLKRGKGVSVAEAAQRVVFYEQSNATNYVSQKENLMLTKLTKLLDEKNLEIEWYKAKLQKYAGDFREYQKQNEHLWKQNAGLRKQNAEIALANTRMTQENAESRQTVKELKFELAGKNGILKAMKLTSMENDHNRAKLIHDIVADESKQSDQKFEEENKGEAERKRMSKSQSSASAVVKQVKSESLPTASSETSENNACTLDPQVTIGRPSRQSALKIVSYKEVPINLKMRRDK